MTIEETAHAAEFFLSDGLIVTGVATGHAADENQVRGTKIISLIHKHVHHFHTQYHLFYSRCG